VLFYGGEPVRVRDWEIKLVLKVMSFILYGLDKRSHYTAYRSCENMNQQSIQDREQVFLLICYMRNIVCQTCLGLA